VQIDKAHRFSDWSARPLSDSQLAYAAADVTHLRKIFVSLTLRLEREGRIDWVGQEMGALADPATYLTDPDTAWEKLRPRTSNRRFLGVLRAIAAWREREAQRINIPRQRLVKDDTLLEIAATMPDSPVELTRARGISENFAKGKSGEGLLAAIRQARALREEELPQLQKEKVGPPPSPALVALLKVLLSAKSEEHDVAPRLLAWGSGAGATVWPTGAWGGWPPGEADPGGLSIFKPSGNTWRLGKYDQKSCWFGCCERR
jgi:ribonuclease D